MKSRHFNVVAPDGVNFELHEDGRIIVELPFTPQQLGAKPLAHKPSNFTFDTFRHGDDDLIELSRDGLAITLSVPAELGPREGAARSRSHRRSRTRAPVESKGPPRLS